MHSLRDILTNASTLYNNKNNRSNWIPNFELNKKSQRAVVDKIPRRPPPKYKPVKHVHCDKHYEMSTKEKMYLHLCHGRGCECHSWTRSFADDATFACWLQNLKNRWEDLTRRNKISFLRAHVWWLSDKPYVGEENQARYGFPRAYEVYLPGSDGIYRYKVCPSMLRAVLNLQGKYRWCRLMTELYEFCCTKQLTVPTVQMTRTEPLWMPEFEEWFLKSVKYEQSHYANKDTPYLVIQPQDHAAAKKKGQKISATPKEMLRDICCKQTY